MNYQLDSACISHIGTVRKKNEDNVFFNGMLLEKDNLGIQFAWTDTVNSRNESVYAVFDGMGGESMGELASYLAAAQLDKSTNKKLPFTGTENFLLTYAHKANDRICRVMRKESITRMGTTAAVVYIKNEDATIMNIGDSRVYLLGENGLNVLTVDHTDEALMQESGISRAPKLTQHLGIFPEEMVIEPHITSVHIHEGNRILICSDGLYNTISLDDIRDLLLTRKTPSETVDLIVSEALRNESDDNVTVMVIDIKRD